LQTPSSFFEVPCGTKYAVQNVEVAEKRAHTSILSDACRTAATAMLHRKNPGFNANFFVGFL
jgi:hypothetical protein